ncbi:tetratricopeptide repeat protein [Sinorhizobium alkalisoli]|uniref:Adenylate cyclase n=1 Tax=Sinorhizobium alkalisoli TaxID=1752398 RepID=A0A1E3V5J9_9HYPH|nr:tetratricopeptide repeat protein [Sinorhizobium alkalisoli]MCG5483761.1 tetratricopeptide repeat protein [Sinorhizobium meliloti]ODR88136.1 adenylate cyclase [Sinorhizobium alkalisoli]
MTGRGYHLQTFGELRLTDAGGAVVVCPERGLLILAYLAASEREVASREKLAALIWPEREKAVAFNNLRSTLWRMRHLATGGGLVLSATEAEVTLGPVTSDLADFEAPNGSEEDFRKALSLWRETFLAFADLPPGRYADWVAEKRRDFTARLRGALIDGEGRFSDRAMLRTASMHLLELDPADTAILEILERASRGPLLEVASPRALLPPGAISREMPGEVSAPDMARVPRVALLPPAAFGSDPMLHAVSVAVIEDITIGLCSLRSMSVVAPYTAERIRDATDKAAFLEKHGVTYALDCHMSDLGLFTQLIFLPSDQIVWAERFPVSPVGLLQQREQIAFHIARAVTHRVETAQAEYLEYLEHPEAYYVYLAGLRNLSGLGLPEVRRARRDFREALKHKQDFAPALSGIARTYVNEWLLTARADEELLTMAEQHAWEAIESNDALSAAHREVGVVKLYRGDLDESLSSLDQAEQLSPHYADVLYSHADTLIHSSRPAEALEKLDKALSLNPLAPDAYLWSAAGASYSLGQYQECIGFVQRMKDKTPGGRLVAASWAMLGNYKKARHYRMRVLKANPTFDVDKWLAVIPFKEQWQKDLYREGLKKAGF